MSSEKGKVIPIPLPTKLDSKVKLIQHLRRYNLENAEPVCFYSPSEEWDNMINILQQIWPNIKESKLPLQKQDTRVIATTKVTVTSLYFRAVAKIGFHYFLHTFSHRFSGRESEFAHICSFIKEVGIWIRVSIQDQVKDEKMKKNLVSIRGLKWPKNTLQNLKQKQCKFLINIVIMAFSRIYENSKN